MASSKATKARTSKKQSKPETTPAVQAIPSNGAASNLISGEDVQEQIRRRAYELYLQRNGQGGSPEQDWLRAEVEVLSRTA